MGYILPDDEQKQLESWMTPLEDLLAWAHEPLDPEDLNLFDFPAAESETDNIAVCTTLNFETPVETKEQRWYQIGMEYLTTKDTPGAPYGNHNAMRSGVQAVYGRTSYKLAAKYHCSEKAVRNYAEYVRAVNRIAHVTHKRVKEWLLSRQLVIPRHDLLALSRKSISEIQDTLEVLCEDQGLPGVWELS